MTTSDEELARAKNIGVDQVALLREARGTTNETLAEMPEGALRKALVRIDHPDMPTERGMFRLQQLRDDAGNVPEHALETALGQVWTAVRSSPPSPVTAGVPTLQDAIGTRSGPAPTAGMAMTAWEWLGPGNIGGRTRGLVIDPDDPDRMWAASAGGGVWHTADGGTRWAPVDDFLGNLACACVAMDPADHARLYVGTGEGFSNGDALRGSGIFTTADTVTWVPLPATQTPDFHYVSRIAVSSTGEVILAATDTGLHRCDDPARATWRRVLGVPAGDVRFDPGDDLRAVAGALRDGEAWYTRDGGLTWTPATRGPWGGRVELAYAARTAEVVYASVQATDGEIWRSDDGGESYRRRATLAPDGAKAKYLATQGWYDNTVWAGDPTDEDLLVVGGINLWRSTDGGNRLKEISTWWDGRSVHADHHAIVSHPGYDGTGNRTVFFGNDGGVFKAADLAAVGTDPSPPYVTGWTELVNNYGATQFYGGAGNVTTGTIVGGTQDNGTIAVDPADGSESWRSVFGGDGGWCAADPTDPDVFYGEYVRLAIHRSTDGATTDGESAGVPWYERYIDGHVLNPVDNTWQWKPVPYRIPDAMTGSALFIAPFVLDPNAPRRLLAGGMSLWRTDDAKAPNTLSTGPKWRAVKPPAGRPVSAIAVAPGHPEVIWVGHADGRVFRTGDGTAATPSWDRVGVTGPRPLEPARYCMCLTAHPDDPDTVYATFGGYVRGNVWVTRDGGARWENLGSALPAAPVRALAVHPRRTDWLYCGTEVGLFASEDAGLTWSPTNEGPTNCSVDDLFWMDTTLVCVTHGRGMFRIDLPGAVG
ncbi:WD40/YVTN/BNR-like repeat-containing protein [Streptomyces sp. enrichment culture]|uniref:WD40/YVTN/BNR-like repeat-containing protein n=1 Tax=Streptomyces sp. enrichment culture TaxID=1795815 RepID=UPI003F56DD4C